MNKKMKIAVVGIGQRGQELIPHSILPACEEYNVEVAAVCDFYEDRTAIGAKLVEEATGKAPIQAKSYDEILGMPDIDGIIISSSWETHAEMAIAAMKVGKFPAFEVGGVYTLEDCWRLVNTCEETGVPCMMLENCCYGQRELLALNMMRQGLFGDVVHCSGGYHHDLRKEISNGRENRHYRLRNYVNRNCENYPTHELGPIAKLLDINNGNRMVSLTSVASSSKGLHEYVIREKGADDPLAKVEFAQSDIVTTIIKCAKGQTIVLTLDTTLPRAYARNFTVRGTKGSYFDGSDSVFLDGVHNEFEWSAYKLWGNAKEYIEKYQHPLWKDYVPKGGHDGMDYMVISAYLESLTTGNRPPIDVYDAAALMCISVLSEQSIQKGGAPVTIPDFTRGKWYMRTDLSDSKYDLDRKDVFEGIY